MDSATTHPTIREEFQWVADRLPWSLKELLRKRGIPVPLDPSWLSRHSTFAGGKPRSARLRKPALHALRRNRAENAHTYPSRLDGPRGVVS